MTNNVNAVSCKIQQTVQNAATQTEAEYKYEFASIMKPVANQVAAIPKDCALSITYKPIFGETAQPEKSAPNFEVPNYSSETEAKVKGFAQGFREYFSEKLEGTGSDIGNILLKPVEIPVTTLASLAKAEYPNTIEQFKQFGSSVSHLSSSVAKTIFPWATSEE